MSEYDIYARTNSRRLFRVAVEKGAALPAGANPEKWKKIGTVPAASLPAEITEGVQADGHHAYEVKIDIKIAES